MAERPEARPRARRPSEDALLKPESRESVGLRSADPQAAPRITLPGLQSERDVERLMEG
jgi:hypothetical protein